MSKASVIYMKIINLLQCYIQPTWTTNQPDFIVRAFINQEPREKEETREDFIHMYEIQSPSHICQEDNDDTLNINIWHWHEQRRFWSERGMFLQLNRLHWLIVFRRLKDSQSYDQLSWKCRWYHFGFPISSILSKIF